LRSSRGAIESQLSGTNAVVIFEIFHEPCGLWRICRDDGLVEGRFRNQRAAIRFARHQYPGNGVMIVFDGQKKPRPPAALAIAG
jgi:hypothetical protein